MEGEEWGLPVFQRFHGPLATYVLLAYRMSRSELDKGLAAKAQGDSALKRLATHANPQQHYGRDKDSDQ